MSLLLLLAGVNDYPLVEPFNGLSGAPHPRWTVTTVGGGTVGLDTNRLAMSVPSPLDVGQALLGDIIPATGIVEYRASYTFTVGTNQTPAFNFRGDGFWESAVSGNRHLFNNGLAIMPNVVAGQVRLYSTVTAVSTLLDTITLTIGATDTVNLHVITSGTAVYWTAWLASGAEIADWRTVTDNNHSARKRFGLALQSPTAAPSTTAYWDDVSANDVPNATGTLARTLGNVTSVAAGASGAAGTFARTLANAVVAASGGSSQGGTLAVTLDPAVVQASGSAGGASGTLARTLGNATVAAAGTTGGAIGTLAATLDAVQTAAPLTDDTGAVITDDAFNPILIQGAEGAHGIGGTLAKSLANVVSAASGVATSSVGSLAVTLGAVTSTTSGTFGDVGTLAKTLADTTSAAAGTVGATGTSAPTLGNVTLAAAGTATPPGTTIAGNVAVTLANAVSAAGGSSTAGAVADSLANLTSAAAGTAGLPTITGVAAIVLAGITGTSAGFAGASGTLARTLAGLTGDAVGSSVVGSVARTLAGVTSVAVGAGAIVDFQPITIRDRGHTVSLREMN